MMPNKSEELEHSFLLSILRYEPDTGRFLWTQDRKCWNGRRTHVVAGDEAGTLSSNGYIKINIDCRPRLAHRLAFFWVSGVWPKGDVDHINGVRTDNRFSNLRVVSRQVNLQNIRGPMKNKKHGGLLGTAWHRQTGKWRALIRHEGRQKSLGYFPTEEAAHQAYVTAKRALHEGCTL